MWAPSAGWSRRGLLAAVCGALAAGAGCGRSTDKVTLTPAPVPTTAGPEEEGRLNDRAGARVDCPRLPRSADRYVCSPVAGNTGVVRLTPETRVYDAGTGGLVFTLANDAGSAFRTGRDWWTLTVRTRSGWRLVAQGGRTDTVTVDPGGQFIWILGGDEPDEDVPRVDVDFGGGRHAFVVTGQLGGEVTAVVAPFRVRPYLG